jgi:hypothetical protein
MTFPAKIDIKYTQKASRLELLVRFVLGFAYLIIANIWGIVIGFALIAQWIIILITGKRNKDLFEFTAGFWRYLFRVYSYVWMLTDERPPISGKA